MLCDSSNRKASMAPGDIRSVSSVTPPRVGAGDERPPGQ
jgi:hypothetical protein